MAEEHEDEPDEEASDEEASDAGDDEPRGRRKLSLSAQIVIGMVAGIACGLFFGEMAAPLQVVGDAFIKLLQMTILPYIVVSLIAGIGGITIEKAKLLAMRIVALLLVFWGVSFLVILIMPLCWPEMESAAFFSTSLVEPAEPVDFVSLYIPSNPFYSLANTVVPAVVLFSLAVGVALIGVERKGSLIEALRAASDALVLVTGFVVRLTPYGVFALAAAAAGTMTYEDLSKMQAYLVPFALFSAILTFWLLPMLVVASTPFRYRDIVGLSRDALVTAFTTGNLFVVLGVLTETAKQLFDRYEADTRNSDTYIDVVIPVTFNFPKAGKLLLLTFVLFAGWFSGNSVEASRYATFVIAGLCSFFGGVDVAMPFMLDLMKIPSDLYQLYVVTGIVNGRFSTLVAAMNLLVFAVLATASLTGILKIRPRQLLFAVVGSVVLLGAAVIGSRLYLGATISQVYDKDRVLAKMQVMTHEKEAKVRTSRPIEPVERAASEDAMERIIREGRIRIGYRQGAIPYSYFNAEGELVGLDVEMAHILATDLDVELEFVPITLETLKEQLESGEIDVAMGGLLMTPARAVEMDMSQPYTHVSIGIVTPDHRRGEFQTLEQVRQAKGLVVGVPNDATVAQMIRDALPDAKVEVLADRHAYFRSRHKDVDICIIDAEGGAALTLLYPQFSVVVPQPSGGDYPLTFAIAPNSPRLLGVINHWIEVETGGRRFQERYQHWIYGKGAEPKQPRWSVIRDVLGWVR